MFQSDLTEFQSFLLFILIPKSIFSKNKISLENERRYFNSIENVQINVQ